MPPAAGDADARPAMGSRLLTVEHRGWGGVGPLRSTVLRVTVTLGGTCTVERVDGKALGDLAERFRDRIDEVRRELENGMRRTTASFRREAPPVARPAQAPPVARPVDPPPVAKPAEAPPVAAPALSAGDPRTTSSIFRVDRGGITDRITRLRQEAAAKADEPPKISDEERIARDRLEEIRTRYWADHRDAAAADEFMPTAAPEAAQMAPQRTTSSVFRVDRSQITDRIERLKRKPDPAPGPPAAPPADGGGAPG